MAAKTDDTGKTDRPRRRNKREEVLLKAAELFARNGFDGTSMRDIAAAVQMLPGSLYYHFPSKEELLATIHERVVADMSARVTTAAASGTTAWDRVEKAAVAHLEALLDTGNLVSIISPNFAVDREELDQKLRAHRNAYETIFKDLFAALDLPEETDPVLLRLQLLGALNWVPVWYAPDGGTSAKKIATSFVAAIRGSAA